MAILVIDPTVEGRILEERRASGADRFDEVWDGVYVMSPLADNEHLELVAGLTTVFQVAIAWAGLGKVLPGTNVTDCEDDWTHNYRCPDVVVYVNGTAAQNRHTHWLGGPDFAVEVVSRGDRSREKLPFYATVGTRELLLVDRDPWALHLFRLEGTELVPSGSSTPQAPEVLASAELPLTFRLVPGGTRPRIEAAQADGAQSWSV